MINFKMNAEFDKSEKGAEDYYDNMYIYGKASTNDIDLDNEVLEPSGFELQAFLDNGMINYEHLAKAKSGSPLYYIGEPVEALVKDDSLFVKAKLFSKSQQARDLWDALHIIESSGSNRRIKWSIEGQPLEVEEGNDSHITKARITHIALTFMPKNDKTWAEIVKGGDIKENGKTELPEEYSYLYSKTEGDLTNYYNDDFQIAKSVYADNAENRKLGRVGRPFKKEGEQGVPTEKCKQQVKVLKQAQAKFPKDSKQFKLIQSKIEKIEGRITNYAKNGVIGIVTGLAKAITSGGDMTGVDFTGMDSASIGALKVESLDGKVHNITTPKQFITFMYDKIKGLPEEKVKKIVKKLEKVLKSQK